MCCENKINVNNEGGRLNDIVILRSISILLVVFVRLRCIYVFFEVNVKNEDWAIPNRIEHFSYVGCMKEDL